MKISPMTRLLIFFVFALSLAAESHFFFDQPIPAKAVQSLGIPTASTAHDVLMINVRLIAPNPFRLRVFYTCKLPGGEEVTYEREARVKPEELWATVAFDQDQILDSEFVRIRFKEEPEPAAIAESTVEAPKQ